MRARTATAHARTRVTALCASLRSTSALAVRSHATPKWHTRSTPSSKALERRDGFLEQASTGSRSVVARPRSFHASGFCPPTSSKSWQMLAAFSG
jgi:hypothetical protein